MEYKYVNIYSGSTKCWFEPHTLTISFKLKVKDERPAWVWMPDHRNILKYDLFGYKLLMRGNAVKLEGVFEKMMPHKVTIDLDMFDSFVEDIVVMSNLNDTSFVTTYMSSKNEIGTLKFYKNQCNQRSFKVVSVKALYLASTLKWTITIYFLLRQDIREGPKKKKNLVVEWQSIESLE